MYPHAPQVQTLVSRTSDSALFGRYYTVFRTRTSTIFRTKIPSSPDRSSILKFDKTHTLISITKANQVSRHNSNGSPSRKYTLRAHNYQVRGLIMNINTISAHHFKMRSQGKTQQCVDQDRWEQSLGSAALWRWKRLDSGVKTRNEKCPDGTTCETIPLQWFSL